MGKGAGLQLSNGLILHNGGRLLFLQFIDTEIYVIYLTWRVDHELAPRGVLEKNY
jgi:hypothetical protein